MKDATGPIVWLLHDEKPGHLTQLRGLANRLKARGGARCHWIDCNTLKVPLWRAILGIAPQLAIPDPFRRPDLIIAAGSRTHRLLFALRRRRGAHTISLMRPSFPAGWISSTIIPEHDHPDATPNTLITCGALNAMTPMASLTRHRHGLILVGGPSRHFAWDGASVLKQIDKLRQNYPNWRWTVSSSRRTPEDILSALRERTGPAFLFRNHRETHAQWLAHTLADSRAVWITPDSVSMVYEALTAGVPTGLFSLDAKPGSRVADGVTALLASGRAIAFTQADQIMNHAPPASPALWEADRAAQWVLTRWQEAR